MESNRRPRESTLIQHPTSHALLTSPTPCQRELVCGACIGTAQFGASLAAPLDSLLKQSSLRSLRNMIIILVAWPSLIVHAQIFCNSKNKRNKAGENEFTFACHLANKLEIEVLWELFNEYTISSTRIITLATLSIKAGLQLKIHIRGEHVSVKCFRSRQLGSFRPPQAKEGYTAFKSMGYHGALDSRPGSEDCFHYCSERNDVVVLFGTLKVQSFILTEVGDCGLLIVVTSSTFLKRKDMFKEKNS